MKALILLVFTQMTALAMLKKIIKNGILFSIFFRQLPTVMLAHFEVKIN
jgi:hypothetical protein